MKMKKLLSFVLAAGMAVTAFPTASATKGPETGVYLSDTMLIPNQYMSETQEVMEGEQVIGENGCVAYFSDTGVLSLYGTMTLDEVSGGDRWGAIGGAVGASDLTIKLLDGADYTLNSAAYSGIYGNYEPVRIEGNGKITINTSGASNGGIVVYGKDGSAESVPTGVTITDGAEVTITGTKGVVFQGNADGDISVTDGAVLTVDTDSAALSKTPVIEEGSLVTVGASAAEAAEWDGSTPLTSYNYVRIAAPGEGGEEPEEPTQAVPTETVTTAPATPDPDLPTENFSKWVGVQTTKDGKLEWLYDGHYVLPDGTHLNTNQNGEPDGSEAIYYDEQTGTLTFSKDITLYGSSNADEYKTYYGAAVSWERIVNEADANRNMIIRLEDGANVTLDATNRDAFTYLYGVYGTGTLAVTGDGTLTIKANAGTSDNYALCVYNNMEGKTIGNIIVKDNVTLKLEDPDANGIGMGLYGNGVGNITIKDNAVVEAYGGAQAINKAPIIPDTAEVTVGDNAETAQAWDKTSDITQYKYVKIDAAGTDTPEEPTEEPTETVTQTPATPDPDLPAENFSRWVGVQPVRDGAIEWLYDGHYVLPDGTHLNTTEDGEPDGSEAIYYDEQTGTLTFSKDITLYGASSADEYTTYYGAAVSWQYAVEDVDQNMAIRLENGANVTLDATNRDAFTYLYGLYGTGTLVITGDGTLTIKANAGTSDNYALCVYNGKEGKTLGNIIIKDNVKLKLEDADDNGIGIGVYGPGAGNITIKDNAVVEAYGGAQAINKAPIIPDTASVTVGDSADTAEAWDKTSDITQYKYVKISASGEEEPEQPTDKPSEQPSGEPSTEAPATTAPATTAPAETEKPAELPESGIIWQDDYEQWSVYDWGEANIAAMRKANGGIYDNIYRMNIGLSEGHGKVLEATTADRIDRGFDWYTKDVLGVDDNVEINKGTLRISAEVCIPSGFVMNPEDQEINDYVWTWSKESLDNSTTDRAYIFKAGATYGETQGRISFQTGEPNYTINSDENNSVAIAFDTWHTIDVIIDYDAGTVNNYVDGNFVVSYPGSPSNVSRYFPVAYMQLHQNGRFTTSDKPLVIQWDNFELELLDDSFDAEIIVSGADYADVKFSKAISDGELSSAAVSARVAGDDSSAIASTGYTRLSTDTVRFSFAELTPASAYELVFGAELEPAFGNGTIAAGTMAVFTTPPAASQTTLIDMTFDSDGGNYWLVHSASAENLSFVDDKDNTSAYAQVRDGVLYYDHYLDVAGQERNGLKFPFEGDTVVDSGKLIVEFDAGVSGQTGRSRAVFGLEDPGKTDGAWTSATVFSGIAPYDGSRLSYTMASEDKRNALTGDSGMDITAAITGQEELHHYRIEIDLDNNSYKLYYDGALAADLDYIPGGNTENSFDAFMMSGVYAVGNFTPDKGQTYIMLDNLKVTAETEAAAVGSVTFVKYDGTETGYSSTVSAGTKEIRIAFTKAMAADTAEHISVDGLDASAYDVTFEGAQAVVTFANCLDAGKAYVLRIDADTKDADGGAMAETVYRFTADAGEVVYNKPVITDNGDTVTAEVTVVNTTANETDGFYITLAAYNAEGMLTGVVPLEAAYQKSEGYTKTFTLTGDSSAFADADSIGAFVFSDLVNIRPLTESAGLNR